MVSKPSSCSGGTSTFQLSVFDNQFIGDRSDTIYQFLIINLWAIAQIPFISIKKFHCHLLL
ncbi:MAG: hypothetical protein QNJ68_01515 [Microcoleaceae cyanobacterium MO_207.B10]|nr:hypothetical protein [Microcoleaceae cyanobacterium MO_207.B10]